VGTELLITYIPQQMLINLFSSVLFRIDSELWSVEIGGQSLQGIKVVIIQVNKCIAVTIEDFKHFLATETRRAFVSGISFVTTVLSDNVGKAKVNKHQLSIHRTPHHIFRLNVAVDYSEAVHFGERRIK
jgi:hypothetical protein